MSQPIHPTRHLRRSYDATRLHAHRLAVAGANAVINRGVVFRTTGRLNRRTGSLASVFLVYPARDEYALAYVYPERIESNRWHPWPVGLIRQNGRFAIMFGVSSNDSHFRASRHTRDLESLVDRMENLRTILGAEQKTFAGVLPGLLAQRGIITDTPEADITATVVVKAIATLKQVAHLSPATPVIVLGGAGYVGRRVVAGLPAQHRVEVVDSVHGLPSRLPVDLHGMPAILLNVAAPGAISDHMADLWPELLVLNEVYPEPSPAELAALADRGVACFHLAGVKARAFPPFPAAYAGAIPCCAAWPSDDLQPVLRHMPPTPDPRSGVQL